MRPTLPTRADWESETKRYVDRREVKASYWKNGRMSPGLLRARRQFRTKNALVGVVLLTFVGGVFAYSMAAVKQDTFDDLDDEVKERAIMDAKRAALSVEDEKRAMQAASAFAKTPTLKGPTLSDRARSYTQPSPEASVSATAQNQGGVLVSLKKLVWGAPPVDNPESGEDRSKPQ
ncbi:hypothetical protein B0H11DRAFT_1924829 [Mycena galericulata]|nr:hypothetical protein B0H11DRAFT_1924829 [Mycena galericulata]